MRNEQYLKPLLPIIFILAFLAASAGLFWGQPGEPFEFTNHRGETVMINGQGLYFYDTVSSAAQMQGNDVIVLVVGLPLLVVAAWLAFRGSLRGRLLLSGTLGFFLYTYMSMSMLTSFNNLFLIFVALFGLSLYAFILSLMAIDVETLPQYFSANLPRRWVAGVLFVVGGFLMFAWLGRIIVPLLQGGSPPLENTTTLVIQAMDLVLIAPLAFLGGILLLRRQGWGYLLASLVVLKGLTLALGVSAMGINMVLHGTPESTGILVPFLILTGLILVTAVLLIQNINVPNEQHVLVRS